MLAYSLILNLITIEKIYFLELTQDLQTLFFNILKTFDRKGKLNALFDTYIIQIVEAVYETDLFGSF